MAMGEGKGTDWGEGGRIEQQRGQCGILLEFCVYEQVQSYNIFPKISLRRVLLQFIILTVVNPAAEQFSKYANIFFLFTACIQQIPGVSPTEPYTTIVPLAVVLMASAFKEVQEDLVSR